MVPNIPIEVWLLAAFIGSCVGLGFSAGYVARHRAWGRWTIGLSSIGIGLLWPFLLFMAFLLLSGPCQPQTPSDPCDGPAMLMMSIIAVTPALFVVSFVLALVGAFLSRLCFPPCRAPNKLRIRVARSGDASCATRKEPPHNSVLN